MKDIYGQQLVNGDMIDVVDYYDGKAWIERTIIVGLTDGGNFRVAYPWSLLNDEKKISFTTRYVKKHKPFKAEQLYPEGGVYLTKGSLHELNYLLTLTPEERLKKLKEDYGYTRNT